MDKAEAEEKAKTELFALTNDVFCPLIKSHCNYNCICFLKPEAFDAGMRGWLVGRGGCTNAMFTQKEIVYG